MHMLSVFGLRFSFLVTVEKTLWLRLRLAKAESEKTLCKSVIKRILHVRLALMLPVQL